jgi:hypothetical protein
MRRGFCLVPQNTIGILVLFCQISPADGGVNTTHKLCALKKLDVEKDTAMIYISDISQQELTE